MPRLLVISAHPDDELFAGGYIAKRAAEGDEIILLYTTRGEGGEVGDPPVGPKDRLGEIRQVEARNAARALGARNVIFLDFVDPVMEIDGVAQPIDATLDEFSEALRVHLDRLRPDAILSHGTNGEYGHPQHIFTHLAVWVALAKLAPWQPRELITWCATFPEAKDQSLLNQDDPADLVLDVTPWLEAKVAGFEAHVSQHAMFKRNSGKSAVREIIRRTESLRFWPTDAPIAEAARWAEIGYPERPQPKDMAPSQPATPAAMPTTAG